MKEIKTYPAMNEQIADILKFGDEPEQYAAQYIKELQSENAALRERLKKAVELPLECGSAVWYLNTHKSISLNENTVYEGILERYHLAPIGGKLYFIVDIRIKNDYGITVLPEVEKDYGKTWFTSREAAEARLAELKGDKQNVSFRKSKTRKTIFSLVRRTE